jgi:hypothetical protein
MAGLLTQRVSRLIRPRETEKPFRRCIPKLLKLPSIASHMPTGAEFGSYFEALRGTLDRASRYRISIFV